MDIGSVVNQGLAGLQSSQASINQSAQQIAQASAPQKNKPEGTDLAESLVNIKVQSQVFDANAKVVKSAEETLGTLINTKA